MADEKTPEGDAPDEKRPRGSMSFQDESTTPREPTLAERRAREQSRRRIAKAEQERKVEEQRVATRNKRILIGSSVGVGVVAVVAFAYWVARPGETTEARCVDTDTQVVVDDANCQTPADQTSANSTASGGVNYVPFPLFIGGGGRQYNYNYNGTGGVGQTVSGGTTTVPPGNQRVATPSGRVLSGGSSSGSSVGGDTGTSNRGGFGVSGRSSSGS